MNWPNPKIMNTICIILNVSVGINCLVHGSLGWAALCFIFAAYCMNNRRNYV